MSFTDKLSKNFVFKALLNIESAILVITTILAAGIVFIGVVLRYVFKSNFFGQEEVLCVVAMWLYWVGGIYGSYEDSHIKGDMLSSLFKTPKAKKIIKLITLGISFVVTVIFSVWGFQYMAFNLKYKAVSTGLKIPLWYSQIPLLIGFILMGLYTLFVILRVLLDPEYGKTTEAIEGGEK